MRFTPTAAQLELLAELQTARMPRALIADRLGVDRVTFKAWTARLDAASVGEADRWRRESETALAKLRGGKERGE